MLLLPNDHVRQDVSLGLKGVVLIDAQQHGFVDIIEDGFAVTMNDTRWEQLRR